MWRSAIACSADYTFISFEMVACYERDRFAHDSAARPSLVGKREVVTGRVCIAYSVTCTAVPIRLGSPCSPLYSEALGDLYPD
jgi:hypothetical protein